MLYNIHEFIHASLSPIKFTAKATKMALRNPFNPFSHTSAGRTIAAMSELVERTTKRFGKPIFGLDHTIIDGKRVHVTEHLVDERPFCHLVKFHRTCKRKDPKVLIVAPLSGHYATLLRGTVEALLPHHDVYITDWVDARQVLMTEGKFDLDDCIAYIMDYVRLIGDDCHVVAVCQPAVPVLAAVSLLAAQDDKKQPASMTLMGGPIDPRVSKTEVTQLAEKRPLDWFERNVIATVPAYYPGAFRRVYPGFVQLTGFMSMNLDRHIGSHVDFYNHLIEGDGESAEKHRVFYDEYNAVMDLTAEFYLQTVETVFQKHSLAIGEMVWTDPKTGEKHPVDPSKIKKTALLTVEGELDDISAAGQTKAAHKLCANLSDSKKYHHLQKNVGHYGIFNGRRWRERIMPRVRQFMRHTDPEGKALSAIFTTEKATSDDVLPQLWATPVKAERKAPASKTTQAKPAQKPKANAKPKTASSAKPKKKTLAKKTVTVAKKKAAKAASPKAKAPQKQNAKKTPAKTKKAETAPKKATKKTTGKKATAKKTTAKKATAKSAKTSASVASKTNLKLVSSQ